MRGIFEGMPWWVKWVAVPLLVLFVFGGVITSIIGAVIGFLFKALLLVALVGGLIFVVRKFKGNETKSSAGEW
ncbi:DUF5326 family protein [Streptomyces sp. NPDC006487]|uniref:DUF5326 family protein n=1 Tax=unclassified Streptomyces TaxID=2593676 RepID=UPI002E166204|nr:DUF5326 family protein [Streptomyces sp. NBC_01244]